MMLVNTIEIPEALGSFAFSKEYIIIGTGIAFDGIQKKNSINVLNTNQEKYRELQPRELQRLAEDTIAADLSREMNVCRTYVTSFQNLPEIQFGFSYNVFVHATGVAQDGTTAIYSDFVMTDSTLDWTENLNYIAQLVYQELLISLSRLTLNTNDVDVTFISFDVQT